MATQIETEKVAELIEELGYLNLASDLKRRRTTAEGTLMHLLSRRGFFALREDERPLIQKALDTICPPRTRAIFRG